MSVSDKLFKFFVVLITSLIILIFALQTKWAKDCIKQTILSYAKKQGYTLTIGKIEGRLPFHWVFHDVALEKEELQIQKMQLRISVFSLLKKQMYVNYLKIEQAQFKNIPFSAVGKIKIKQDQIQIPFLLIENPSLHCTLKAKMHPDLKLEEASMAFSIRELNALPFLNFAVLPHGALQGTLDYHEDQISADCKTSDLIMNGFPLEPTTFKLQAKYSENRWQADLTLQSKQSDAVFNGQMALDYFPLTSVLSVKKLELQGPELDLYGQLKMVNFSNLEGTVYLQARDLKKFRSLFHDADLSGALGTKIDFSKKDQVHLSLELQDFHWKNYTLKEFQMTASLSDIFHSISGELLLEGSEMTFSKVTLSSFEFRTHIADIQSPFSLNIKGNWKDPLNFSSSGFWNQKNGHVLVHLENCFGSALKQSFFIEKPLYFEVSPKMLKIENLLLQLGNGHLSGHINLSQHASLVKIKGQHVPLQFLSLSQKDLTLNGSTSFDLDLVAWKENVQGTLNLALENAWIHALGKEKPVRTKGSLQMHLDQHRIQTHVEIKATDDQYLDFSASTPIQYTLFPFHIEFDKTSPFTAELTMEGKLQDLFDFVNIGSHRLEGWLSSHLFFSKTLSSPAIKGNLELHQGIYENYNTGTFLKNISAKAFANQQEIHCSTFEATDQEEGKVSATGVLHLNPTEQFPYIINAELTNLRTLVFDTISGNFSGPLLIKGNRLKADAKGDLIVEQADFQIPDQLPFSIPQLPVVFINPPEHMGKKALDPLVLFPFNLDVNLTVPKRANVTGKGLNSEWQGNLHLTGNYPQIQIHGDLSLIKGEYLFWGKVFSLTQGEIIFNETATPVAYISLKGTCDLDDTNVTVTLQGPLSSPLLSFQSIPYQPTSSLLAQILFNKDISEISAVQAVQLAQTILSLSGKAAPDILEKIRKTLGIDRLNITVSREHPDKLYLQIGKYLMRGVLLTLTQGVDSRNITIEVDLTRGFIFQAELGEDEQGKFSLKWHHHY